MAGVEAFEIAIVLIKNGIRIADLEDELAAARTRIVELETVAAEIAALRQELDALKAVPQPIETAEPTGMMNSESEPDAKTDG